MNLASNLSDRILLQSFLEYHNQYHLIPLASSLISSILFYFLQSIPAHPLSFSTFFEALFFINSLIYVFKPDLHTFFTILVYPISIFSFKYRTFSAFAISRMGRYFSIIVWFFLLILRKVVTESFFGSWIVCEVWGVW